MVPTQGCRSKTATGVSKRRQVTANRHQATHLSGLDKRAGLGLDLNDFSRHGRAHAAGIAAVRLVARGLRGQGGRMRTREE